MRRAHELEAAHLQQKARAAARRHDWHGVAAALKKAERIAENNPWVADSLSELRALAAQKDEESFSKEAMFASNRMNTRLAQKCEAPNLQDALSASYLRRKSRQGKAGPNPPQA